MFSLIKIIKNFFSEKSIKSRVASYINIIFQDNASIPSINEITVDTSIDLLKDDINFSFSILAFCTSEYEEFNILSGLEFFAKKGVRIYIICDPLSKKSLNKKKKVLKNILKNHNVVLYSLSFDMHMSVLLKMILSKITTKYTLILTGNTFLSRNADIDIDTFVDDEHLLFTCNQRLIEDSREDYSLAFLSGTVFENRSLLNRIDDLLCSRFWSGQSIITQYTKKEILIYDKCFCKNYTPTKLNTNLFAYIIKELIVELKESTLIIDRSEVMHKLVSTVRKLTLEKKLTTFQKMCIMASCALVLSLYDEIIPNVEKWKHILSNEFNFDMLPNDKNIKYLFDIFIEEVKLGKIYDILIIENKGMNDIKNSLFYENAKKIYKIKYIEKLINFDYYNFNNMIIRLCSSFARLVIGSGSLNKSMLVNNSPHLTLWHGLGLMKETVVDKKNFTVGHIICSSKDCEQYYLEHFPAQSAQGLGSVQTDKLFDEKFVEHCRKEIRNSFKLNANVRVVLFAPTFRIGKPNYYNFGIDIEELSNELKKHNICIIAKKHYVFDHVHRFYGKDTSGLHTAKNRFFVIDTKHTFQELICACDTFVTDYSSGMFYAAVRNVPIVLYAPDYREYMIGENGLIIKYPDDIPANYVLEPSIKSLVDALLNPINTDSDKYALFRKKHVGDCDGKVHERVLERVANFLQP